MIKQIADYLDMPIEQVEKFNKAVLNGFMQRILAEKNSNNLGIVPKKLTRFLENPKFIELESEPINKELETIRRDLHNHCDYTYLQARGLLQNHLIKIKTQYKNHLNSDKVQTFVDKSPRYSYRN